MSARGRFLRWLTAALAILSASYAVALFLKPPWWVTAIVIFVLLQPVAWVLWRRSAGRG